jgi:hypothetical protein
MSDLDRLRRKADKHAEAFSRSLSETSRRARPSRLMDDAVHALDPEFRVLRRVEAAVQRHPIVVLATLMGLSWLAAQTITGDPKPPPSQRLERRPRSRRISRPRNQKEGDYTNGNQHYAERRDSDQVIVVASEEGERLRAASRPQTPLDGEQP